MTIYSACFEWVQPPDDWPAVSNSYAIRRKTYISARLALLHPDNREPLSTPKHVEIIEEDFVFAWELDNSMSVWKRDGDS